MAHSSAAILLPMASIYNGTWDSTHMAAGMTLSNASRDLSSSATNQVAVTTTPILQKSYWEFLMVAKGGSNITLGAAVRSVFLTNSTMSSVVGLSYNSNGGMAAPLNVAYGLNDRIGIAVDPATGGMWFRKNGTWLGNDPTGAAALTIGKAAGRVYHPVACCLGGSHTVRFITDPGALTGSMPSGYSPLVNAARVSFRWNSADIAANLALSENNTKITKSSTGNSNARIGIETASGKQVWAVQVTADGAGTTLKGVGMCSDTASLTTVPGGVANSCGYRTNGSVFLSNASVQTYATWGAVNDIVMVAYDATTRAFWFGLNGTWNGDPGAVTGAAGTMGSDGTTENYRFLVCGSTDAGDAHKLIAWPYSVPTGYTAESVAP